MGAERWDEQVGSVADEAARLLESLRRTAADPADGTSGPGAAGREHAAADGAEPSPHTGDAHRATGDEPRPGCDDPFCQWCPLCRTSAVVRSLSPETLARLADLAGVAAAVLADLASARSRGTEEDATTSAPKGANRPPAHPIPVRDADDDAEEAPRG